MNVCFILFTDLWGYHINIFVHMFIYIIKEIGEKRITNGEYCIYLYCC